MWNIHSPGFRHRGAFQAHDVHFGLGMARATSAPSAVVPAMTTKMARYARARLAVSVARSPALRRSKYTGPPSMTPRTAAEVTPSGVPSIAKSMAPTIATPIAPPTARETDIVAVAAPSDSHPAAC